MKIVISTVALSLLVSTSLHAGWQDMFSSLVNEKSEEITSITKTPSSKTTTSSIESDAFKVALKQGVDYAIKSLGKDGGFLNDKSVKIPLPESLQSSAEIAKKLGAESLITNVEKAMNDAASEAVPKTAEVFYNTISKLSVDDATTILKGSQSSLTDYFHKNSYDELVKVISPIVKEYTDKNQLTMYYKNLTAYYEDNKKSIPYLNEAMTSIKDYGLDSFLPTSDENIDEYVTKKAIDGLFSKIAKEEKAIRENPLEQSSKLLRDIFAK